METAEDKAFGERILKIIHKVGNAQKLAKLTGMSGRAIGQYTTGSTDPTRKRLLALAKAGNVSVEWLATGIGPEQSATGTFYRELLVQTVSVLEGSLKKRGLELDPNRRGKVTAKLFENLLNKNASPDDVDSIEKETI